MNIKIPKGDIKRVFRYLDDDNNGCIDYREFCNLCEEKRRKIDPFEALETKSVVLGERYRTSSVENKERSIKTEMAMTTYNGGRSKRNKSHFDQKKIYGVATMGSDNIRDVVENNYQKDFITDLVH